MTSFFRCFLPVLMAAALWGAEAHAAPPARPPVSELEIDFQIFLQKHESGVAKALPPSLVPELETFASRFRTAGESVNVARAFGRVALIELRAGHLPEAASAVAKASAALPSSERSIGAQLALLDSRIAELQGRYADAFRNHARGMALAARPGAPKSKANLDLNTKDGYSQLMAASKAGAERMLELTQALTNAAVASDPAYTQKFNEVWRRMQRGTQAERARAAAEFRAMSAARAREVERARMRIALEQGRKWNQGTDAGFDGSLGELMKATLCSPKEASAALSPYMSFGTFRDRVLSGSANSDAAKRRALSEPAVILAWALQPARNGTVPEPIAELPGTCFSTLLLDQNRGFTERVNNPLEPESYLTAIMTGLAKAGARTSVVDGFLVPTQLALAERKRQRGDLAGAKSDWKAALHRMYEKPDSIDARRVAALQAFAELAVAEDRATILADLALEQAALEKRAAIWPSQKPWERQNIWADAAKHGMTESAFRAASPGDASTANTLFGQTSQLSSPLMAFGEASERVVLPLGVARIHDRVGNTQAADRIRAAVAATVAGPLSGNASARSMFEAVSHADLAEREERAQQTPEAERDGLLAAHAWAKLLGQLELLTYSTGFATSRSPNLVFERAVRAELAHGDAGAAFELAELARSLNAPSRAPSKPPNADPSLLEQKLTAAEERALKSAAPEARARLTLAVTRARADSKPRTVLVSPLAAAGGRIDALRGYLPRAQLAELAAELDAFEGAYQSASSAAAAADATKRAASEMKDAEVNLRAGNAAAFGARQRARDEVAAARAASRVRSPLTFRSFARVAELQSKLGPTTSLVAYWFGVDELFAFVVTQAGVIGLPLPGVTRASVEMQVARARSGDLSSLQSTYAMLVAPLRKALKGSELLIVSDGAVRYLPLEALHDGTHHLFEEFSVRRASYASDLLATSLAPAAVDRVFAGAAPAVPGFAQLSRARDELGGIQKTLASVHVVTDTSLTKAALLGALPGHQLVHVAAHGQSDAKQPIFSRLYLRDDTGQAATLEAREIESLRLAGLELVVLSACATAGAPRTASEAPAPSPAIGDDVASLSDAFVSAGARSVVATLWAVDDATTAAFMQEFYAALARGLTKPAALDAARRSLLASADYSSPRQWGAFILVGNPAALSFSAPSSRSAPGAPR